MPYEPRWDRSLRSLAEFPPAPAASWSLDTVTTPRSATPAGPRRYTGSRDTVASGRCSPAGRSPGSYGGKEPRDMRRRSSGDRRETGRPAVAAPRPVRVGPRTGWGARRGEAAEPVFAFQGTP